MIKKKEKESFIIMTVIYMKENLKKIYMKVKEYIILIMEIDMKEILKMM